MKTLPFHYSSRGGFTLTEVLVSSALIVAVMGLMLTTIDQTRRTINSTTARVSQFQSARVAFDSMTRTLSQATLNSYWDMDRSGDEQQNPLGFRRNSDMHFISGKAYQDKILMGTDPEGKPRSAARFPGHAVFFQAPIGVTAEQETSPGSGSYGLKRYRGMTNLLSACGFYVRWDEDASIPDFMGANEKYAPSRMRFRLMEVRQPAERLMLYADQNYTTVRSDPTTKDAKPGVGYPGATDWLKVAVGTKALPTDFTVPMGEKKISNSSRSLAENIVALIILPKVPVQDRTSADRLDDLTTNFEYDSCPQVASDAMRREFRKNDPMASLKNVTFEVSKVGPRALKQLHQLPPILQVTMVAIDESSAQKLQDYVGSTAEPPEFTSGLFGQVTTQQAFLRDLGDPANLNKNSLVYRLSNPKKDLPTPRLTYRVFTTDVVLRGSKWSK